MIEKHVQLQPEADIVCHGGFEWVTRVLPFIIFVLWSSRRVFQVSSIRQSWYTGGRLLAWGLSLMLKSFLSIGSNYPIWCWLDLFVPSAWQPQWCLLNNLIYFSSCSFVLLFLLCQSLATASRTVLLVIALRCFSHRHVLLAWALGLMVFAKEVFCRYDGKVELLRIGDIEGYAMWCIIVSGFNIIFPSRQHLLIASIWLEIIHKFPNSCHQPSVLTIASLKEIHLRFLLQLLQHPKSLS